VRAASANMTATAIFVDVQNVYYTTRDAYARQFNYRRLWEAVAEGGTIVAANAYATEPQDANQERFQKALRHIGFKVRTKPYIQRSDGSAKGDWDVGITIDVLEAAREIERIVLVSGDGDFDLLLHKIIDDYRVIAEVYGVPRLTAKSLVDAATSFRSIDESMLL
jgi:uncharacterized LabA/DUF88 family protein